MITNLVAVADAAVQMRAAPIAVPTAGTVGIFDFLEGLVSDGTSLIKAFSVLLALAVVVFATIRGRFKLPAIIGGIVAGGLIVWGVFNGVDWMKERAEGELNASVSQIDTHTQEGLRA
jgi:hypothetical protein